MKKGDLVRSVAHHRGVGIIIRAFAGANGLVIMVYWPNGNEVWHGENIDTLQKVDPLALEPEKQKNFKKILDKTKSIG